MGEREIRDNLDKYVNDLKEYFNIKLVVLYGSFAQGTADENSDIDIAVFINAEGKQRNFLQDSALINKLILESDTRIEPILFYSSDLESVEQASFLAEVLEKGKVIFRS